MIRRSATVIGAVRCYQPFSKLYGLTTADIEAYMGRAKKRGRKPGVKVAVKSSASVAKFRGPKSGATWTGHGRAPAWVPNQRNTLTRKLAPHGVPW